MNNFRERAREIKAAGEKQRGNFEPSGVPLRMYNYWLKHSDSSGAFRVRTGLKKENFCHFWRVVAFWAPLLFLRKKVFTDGVLAALAIIAFLVGVLAIVFLAEPMDILVGVGAGAALAAAGIGFWYLIKCLANRWTRKHSNILMGTLVAMSILALLGVFGVVIYQEGLVLFLQVLGLLLVVTLVVLAFMFLASSLVGYLEGRRALAKEAAIEQAIAEGMDPIDAKYHVTLPPGRVKKFFIGVGDFLILAAQVVRVKKWKICPVVEVDTQNKV